MSRYTVEQCKRKISTILEQITRCSKEMNELEQLNMVATIAKNRGIDGKLELIESRKDLYSGLEGSKAYWHRVNYKEIIEKAYKLDEGLETAIFEIGRAYKTEKGLKEIYEGELEEWRNRLSDAYADEEKE